MLYYFFTFQTLGPAAVVPSCKKLTYQSIAPVNCTMYLNMRQSLCVLARAAPSVPVDGTVAALSLRFLQPRSSPASDSWRNVLLIPLMQVT